MIFGDVAIHVAGETVQAGGQLDPNSAVSFYVAGMDLTQVNTACTSNTCCIYII